MTTDTPKRSGQASQHSDRARQPFTFPVPASTERGRIRRRLAVKTAFCAGILLLLALAGFSALSKGRPSTHARSRGPGKRNPLRQFRQSASNELQNCTATSRSPVCDWARKHNRANRKRPVDWEPKEGWPEDAVIVSTVRHASDRALAAVGNVTTSTRRALEPLQSVAQSIWPAQKTPEAPATQQQNLAQCTVFHSHACIAVIGGSCSKLHYTRIVYAL